MVTKYFLSTINVVLVGLTCIILAGMPLFGKDPAGTCEKNDGNTNGSCRGNGGNKSGGENCSNTGNACSSDGKESRVSETGGHGSKKANEHNHTVIDMDPIEIVVPRSRIENSHGRYGGGYSERKSSDVEKSNNTTKRYLQRAKERLKNWAREYVEKMTLKEATKKVGKLGKHAARRLGFAISILWPDEISKDEGEDLIEKLDFEKLNRMNGTLSQEEEQEINSLWDNVIRGDKKSARELYYKIHNYRIPHISNIKRQDYRKKNQDCTVISPSIYRRTSPRN